jgi:hypothetical protein
MVEGSSVFWNWVFRRPSMRRIWTITAPGLVMCAAVFVLQLARIHWHGFILSAIREAWEISSHVNIFVLSLLGVGAFSVSVVIKFTRHGRQAVREHITKHLFESVIPAAIVLFCLFSYNLFYAVPARIFRDARDNSLTPRVLSRNTRYPIPPENAYRVSLPRLSPLVETAITPIYTIMPFDPPYAPDTVVAGIKFIPGTFDVRLSLSLTGPSVSNIDFTILLVNTAGQRLLSILDIAQQTRFPNITFVPVTSGNVIFPPAGTLVNPGGSNSTMPIGGTSSQGRLIKSSSMWRIHCDSLLEGLTPDFVLMVTRPGGAKMIEGFLIRGTYEYKRAQQTKVGTFERIVEFDDSGTPHIPTEQISQTILKQYPPSFKPGGSVRFFSGSRK